MSDDVFKHYQQISHSSSTPFRSSSSSCLSSQLFTMSEYSLAAVLCNPTTIHFVPGTDEADLGDLLVKNPQRTADGYVWLLPDRKTEATVTFVGKIIYGAIGDKTGPYFSLPDPLFVCILPLYSPLRCAADFSSQVEDISPVKMAKVKAGFAVRLINRELVVDALLSDELIDHNQAALEFFMAIQEDADRTLDSSEYLTHASPSDCWLKVTLALSGSAGGLTVRIRPFIKVEDGNPFYVVPVVSEPLFPQFKGGRPIGVMRAKGQKGGLLLFPLPYFLSDNTNVQVEFL